MLEKSYVTVGVEYLSPTLPCNFVARADKIVLKFPLKFIPLQ